MILQLLTWLATAGIIAIFVHVVRLWFVSRPAAVPPATTHGAADGFLFAFLVPALNEARVIEHTLDRLLSLPVRQCLVLVIDDGSDDGTGYFVESHHDPRVRLLRREFPDARRGKGAALNAGFHWLLQEIGSWPADKVIVGIMDADGRLDQEAPARVAEYFADADVGAVQIGVRISNR
jgi:glycosyltransferase involved in cell wall biosynthesis